MCSSDTEQFRQSEAAAHMDFGAATLEEHFVHHVIDEIDAAPVILIKVLAVGGIGNRLGIESGAGVADDDQHAMIVFENNGALHEL